MKKVTSQNIGYDGLMMDFAQIQHKLKEFYQGDELFIVVANDDDNFIQVCQPLVADIFEIQIRYREHEEIKFYEKAVIGFDELERYFQAYYDNEEWLFEDFKTWVDISECSKYNVQKISHQKYLKEQFNHQQIMEVVSNLKNNETLVLFNISDYYFLKIDLYKTENTVQYELEIKKENQNYYKTVRHIEAVQRLVNQYLNHEKMNLKAWQSSTY